LALTKGPAGRAMEVKIPLGPELALPERVPPIRKAVGEGPLRLAQCVAKPHRAVRRVFGVQV